MMELYQMAKNSPYRDRKPIKPQDKILRFPQSHPKMFDSLIGLVFTVIMLLCAEGGFYILNQTKYSPEVQTKIELLGYKPRPNVQASAAEKGTRFRFKQKDKLLGYKPQPNVQVSAIKKRDREIVYNAIYTFDEYSRRVTPVDRLEHRSDFILLFGCSFTFGTGVNDDETMPFYVSQFAPRYRPYNYGFEGYGPQQMLAKLQSSEITKEVNEANGILIYIFLDDHVRRAIGSMNIYNRWGSNMPFYTIDSNDRLVRKGDFTSGRPVLSSLYDVVGKSQIVKYFNIDLPRINDAHIRTTAGIIEEARSTFRDKFNSDDFYVLFYPGSTQYAKRIISCLENAGIKYLDYSNLTYQRIGKGDGHPTACAHMTVAAKVVADLGILDTQHLAMQILRSDLLTSEEKTDLVVRIGNQLVGRGEAAQAIDLLNQFATANTANAQVWVVLGKAYIRERNWDRAISAFEKALVLDPQNYWGNHLLAGLYARQGEWQAIVQLEQVALQVTTNDERRVNSGVLLVEAYEKLGDRESACAVLQQIRQWAEEGDRCVEHLRESLGCQQ